MYQNFEHGRVENSAKTVPNRTKNAHVPYYSVSHRGFAFITINSWFAMFFDTTFS